jgi:hypothetical protein
MAEFEIRGGPPAAVTSIKKLDEALAKITGGKVKTGGIRTATPEILDPIFYADSVGAENLVKSVAVQGVKAIFPGAVSDFESKSILDRIWNRNLPLKDNVNNVIRERNNLAAKAKAETDKYSYFKANDNSMLGYKGLDPSDPSNAIDQSLFDDVTSDQVFNKKKPAQGLLANPANQNANAVAPQVTKQMLDAKQDPKKIAGKILISNGSEYLYIDPKDLAQVKKEDSNFKVVE